MNRLTRNRSQHFASSPRKVASPMKHKHGPGLARHSNKRRRVGSSGVTALEVDVSAEEEPEEVENEESTTARQHKGKGKEKAKAWEPLSSEGGLQRVNRGTEAVDRKIDKGKGRAVALPARRDVFQESPRKRKRGDVPVIDTDDAMEEVEDEGGGEGSCPSVAGSGSWIEVDEDDQDEDEPEFIAESDQHLLADAPAYALRRLKKAELIRLWRVAGMWKEEDDGATVSSTGDDDGLGKKDLVDGLISARKSPTSRHISSLPSPRSTLRAKALITEGNKHSYSYPTSPRPPSPSLSPPPPLHPPPIRNTSRNRVQVVIDATPKAVARTRSRVRPGRKSDGTPHPVGRSANRQNGSAAGKHGHGRIARFGNDVKSPANGLTARSLRQTSSLSSMYTTTDGSDGEEAPPRTTRRTRKRAQSQSHRPSSDDSDQDGTEVDDDEEREQDEEGETTDADAPDPTPLVARLRSRTKSIVDILPPPSEPDADDEDEEGDTEEDEDSSPGPNTRTRSQLIASSDSNRSAGGQGASLPRRGAKAKALRVLLAGRSPSLTPDEDEGMEVERDVDPEGDEEMEDDDEGGEVDEDVADGDETEQTEIAEPIRQTRSGQAFGDLRARKRRLRQEALDDPDMEVDEEDVAAEDEEEEEEDMEDASDEGSVAEFDIDLDASTVSSLSRLLRDELVQLCESRGIEVGGTKPQLAKALIEWRDEQNIGSESPTSSLSSSSQVTARPSSPKQSLSLSKSSRSRHTVKNKLIHAIGSNHHVRGKQTPVLLRDHIHAEDPATPPAPSDEGKQEKDADLNLDLAELGLEDSIILPEHLVKLERIGSGGFKDVYVGKCKGRKVAISEFRSHLSEMDIRELKLLSEFSHPNIVRFKGICIPEDSSQIQCMLVSELCENGDLFDYIRNVGTPSLKRLLGLMLDIARGLEYLHTRRPAIIHRDCKSSNILINRAGQAKVGDFGLARVKTSTRSMIRSLVGTVNWQAPELWHASPRYDYKVDVFSAGMVYWEMLSGWTGEKKYPWEGHNEHYIYDVVGQKSRRPSVAGLRKHWGAEPVNLMERMWHQDPSERPTMSDVVADLEALISEV